MELLRMNYERLRNIDDTPVEFKVAFAGVFLVLSGMFRRDVDRT